MNARIGSRWKLLLLLATDRGLFLECHDSITGGKICHQAVAGVGYRSNVLEGCRESSHAGITVRLGRHWESFTPCNDVFFDHVLPAIHHALTRKIPGKNGVIF